MLVTYQKIKKAKLQLNLWSVDRLILLRKDSMNSLIMLKAIKRTKLYLLIPEGLKVQSGLDQSRFSYLNNSRIEWKPNPEPSPATLRKEYWIKLI